MGTGFVESMIRSAAEVFSRRGALRGFAAATGLAALTPTVSAARKGKRKKRNRCNRCPRRNCCECTGVTGPSACRYVATETECEEFCAGALSRGFIAPPPDFATFCTMGNSCVLVECPAV